MKNKIQKIVIVFIISLLSMIPIANAQTMGSITRMATGNLNGFLTMYIGGYTNGNTDGGGKTYANYCMNAADHGAANGSGMPTSVVDVGANGMASVNGLSTANSEGARRAMEVLYYATKSYMNQEVWGRTRSSPYRLMMMQTAAVYAGVINGTGLFGGRLPGGFTEEQMKIQFGSARYYQLKSEGEAYVNSTRDYAFSDRSTKNIQTIEEVGNWVFVGPYRIQNTGKGYISDIAITTMNGTVCRPDGWATSVKESAIVLNKNLPNGSNFYFAFKTQKPDSAEKVTVTKRADNVLRARMVFYASTGGQDMATYGGRTTDSTTQTISLPKVPFTNIKITKLDQDSGQGIGNVGFTVYVETEKQKGWLKDGTPAKIVTKEEATIYRTKENGTVTIRNIKEKGNYTIHEVVNPNFGYIETSIENPCQSIEVQVKAIGQTINQTLKNKRLYVKLSGYAWEDRPDTSKQTKLNGLYDEGGTDKRLKNITVTLKKSNGEVIDTRVTQTILNTKGKMEEGAYLFGDYQRDPTAKKIKIEDLRGARIEFEYNGMCYKSVEVKPNVKNGSKATDDKLRPQFNENFATITKGIAQSGGYLLNYQYENHKATLLYGGEYLYGYDGQKYPISGIDSQYRIIANTMDASPNNLLGQAAHSIDSIYKNEVEEVANINLGVREREMPDISLVQDIDSAQIGLNGYWHTYRYSDRFSELNRQIEEFNNQHKDDGEVFGIGVNFGEKFGPDNYTSTIYSSDIVYKAEDEKGNLDVFIKYRIRLRNEAGTVNTKVNELYNYFDPDYNIAKIQDQNGNDILYTIENELVNGRSKVRIHPNGGIQIQHNSEQYIDITYQLKDEAIIKILNQDKTLDSITEIVSYSSFDDEAFTNRYAGVDKDSEPNNSNIEDINTYEDDIDKAPSLILKSDHTRILQGTVWHENAIEELLSKQGIDKERVGNGQYEEEKEKVIKQVKVELLKQNEEGNFEPTRLYQTSGSGENRTRQIVETATDIKHTNEFGEYTFVGVIPGKYVIRFIYKNDSIICNTDGTEFKTLEEAEGGVEYYKSTSFRTSTDANRKIDDTAYQKDHLYWYADETKAVDGKRLSDAKDNEELATRRTSVTTINYDEAMRPETNGLEEIMAETNVLEIRMDCNADDIANITKDTSQYGQKLRFVFDNIDFGIIRRPKQDLQIRKEISYVEVTLANGQVIIKGDPRVDKIQHLKFLPNGNVHIELDSEIIQGATLKLDYEITVDNTNCEIDYNDMEYYNFGRVKKKESWKIATVADLFDYPSSGLNFNEANNPGWQYLKLKDVGENRLAEGLKDVLKTYNVILHTEKFATMQPGEIKTETMKLTRLLGNTDQDYSFDNDIEINTYDGRKMDYTIPGNYNPKDSSTSEKDDDSKNIVITGPTGKDKNVIPYIVLGITSLIMLTVGVIIIKRKVLTFLK